MDNCEKYIELISAGIDGELSQDELSELKEHLKNCPECRKYAFLVKEASAALTSMTEEVPESLVGDVMAAITPKKRRWTAGRIGTIAAAAALVIIAAYVLPRGGYFGMAKSAAAEDNTATATVTEAYVVQTEEAAEEIVVESGFYDYSEKQENSLGQVEYESQVEETKIEEAENLSVEDGAAEDSGNDKKVSGMPALPYSDVFYRVAVYTGELDDTLAAFETEQGTESETYVFIPAEEFDALSDEYDWEVYYGAHNIDSSAETAIVVVY